MPYRDVFCPTDAYDGLAKKVMDMRLPHSISGYYYEGLIKHVGMTAISSIRLLLHLKHSKPNMRRLSMIT